MRTTTINELKPGDQARVSRCLGVGPVFQRLLEMGFIEGASLRMVRAAPFGDPLEVVVEACHFSLRKAEAAMIQVERLAREPVFRG